ncbi:DUF3426 domain-containing protein [Chitinibacter sp. S2-10]|uniref:DUF3426 domain-containing protein n=1 Tax=Chitinibacter sp. S2-10 TaxID=3373597 RepID=UPI00397735BC
MNQITRCPNCSTSFRVTDEQLAAHQGKVRCGRCAFIFNARDFLQQASTTPRPNKQTEASNTEQGISPEINKAEQQQAIPQEKPIGTEQKATIAPVSKPQVELAAPNPAPEPTTAQQQLVEPDQSELKISLARLQQKTQREKIRKQRKMRQHTEIAAPESIELPETDESQVSAQQAALKDESEYRPILDESDPLFLAPKTSRFNWLWSLGCFIAFVALALQLVYNLRLELSREFPALRPKWIALCTHLHCEMPLPRQGDMLRSEWSELTYIPEHPTLIQVKATLRNLAPYEQALPKLELTLTDEHERIVAKKVFSAKEYLTEDEAQLTSILPNNELHAFLQLDLGELNSTGYSLFWFYD